MTEGRKDDNDKPRLDLIHPSLFTALGAVLQFGAVKYGDRNWENGLKFGRVYAATMRHLTLWWGGENLDSESDMPHLWHALCNVMFLVAFSDKVNRKLLSEGFDDRPKANSSP